MQHFRRLAATVVVGSLVGLGSGAGPAAAQAITPPVPAPAAEAPADSVTPAAAATSSGFTQRGVPAEATAENAVIARTRAIASAQRIAYERLASEMNLPRGLSDSQIDNMVSSIIVEEERTSRTGYNGRLTVNFNPNRIPGAGGRATAAAPNPGDAAAPPVVPRGPAAGFVEADIRFGGFREWLEIRRRLVASPEVVSVDIEAIAVDGARLRLGLRRDAASAAQAMPASGLTLATTGATTVAPSAPVPVPGRLAPPVPWGAPAAAPAPVPAPMAGGLWQLGLAGGV